ncbi:MAG: PqqD family protein [Candidatus Omnitrophota bacterium]
MRIRQSKNVLVADFDDKKVVLNTDSYKPYLLNPTASEAWDLCKTLKKKSDIVDFLSKEYKVDIKKVRIDVKSLINDLKKAGLIKTIKR